jgi:hypothetical protein
MPGPSKQKLFQLPVMTQLIDGNSFLEREYEKFKQGAEDRLGYHWNEAVQIMMFNRYVKENPKLLRTYKRLLATHRKEKEAEERAGGKKKKKGGNTDSLPPTETPAIVDPLGRVDTRLTLESSTGDGGVGAYETPFFLATPDSFARHWRQKSGEDGIHYVTEAHTPQTMTTPLTALEDLLQRTQLLSEAEGLTTAQQQTASIKKENERLAAEDTRRVAQEQARNFSEKLDDGSQQVKVDSEVDAVDNSRPATDKQQKHLDLNRGMNELDRALVAQPDLDKDILDRYREQAGQTMFKDSEAKVDQYQKEDPSARPAGRTEVIKEMWQCGRTAEGTLHRFDAGQTRQVSELPADAVRLELRGQANGEPLLRESYEFYVDLTNQQYLRIPIEQAPAPEPMRVNARSLAHWERLAFGSRR